MRERDEKESVAAAAGLWENAEFGELQNLTYGSALPALLSMAS